MTSVLTHIGDDVSAALDLVCAALVVPSATVVIGDAVVARSGSEVLHTRSVPLIENGVTIGALVVGLRPGDLGLRPDDERVLRIVAPLLVRSRRAQMLAEELARSRGSVIAAVEDERRRLRRDLHDGLGPTLTGVAFSVDAARNQLALNPDEAAALLVRIRADIADAIAEVRRLVEGLRPPALDELGLVGALETWSSRLYAESGVPLAVTISIDESLPALSAATEVAAYRIVVEALTNAARHSGSTVARVDLRASAGDLAVLIEDQGRGLGDADRGVGLASMRERAAQLGGRVDVSSDGHGTRVQAHIPITA